MINLNVEEPSDTYPLMTCEAFFILDEQRNRLLDPKKSKNYIKLFESTLNYSETCARIGSRGQAETLRNVLSRAGLNEIEVTGVGSLFPQSTDEAKILIPTLCRFSEEELSAIIKQIDEV